MTKKEKREKNNEVTPKFLSIIYLSVILFCIALLATLIVLAALRIDNNNQLKAKEASIVEKYNEVATTHEQLNDADYAKVYFDDNVMVIPSEDVVIEYQP